MPDRLAEIELRWDVPGKGAGDHVDVQWLIAEVKRLDKGWQDANDAVLDRDLQIVSLNDEVKRLREFMESHGCNECLNGAEALEKKFR